MATTLKGVKPTAVKKNTITAPIITITITIVAVIAITIQYRHSTPNKNNTCSKKNIQITTNQGNVLASREDMQNLRE